MKFEGKKSKKNILNWWQLKDKNKSIDHAFKIFKSPWWEFNLTISTYTLKCKDWSKRTTITKITNHQKTTMNKAQGFYLSKLTC